MNRTFCNSKINSCDFQKSVDNLLDLSEHFSTPTHGYIIPT